MTLLSVLANSYAADGAYEGWINPTNAYAADGIYATREGTDKNIAYGNLYGFDLSALPDTATINSVTVSAAWHNSLDDANGPKFMLGVKSGGAVPGYTLDSTGQVTDEIVTYQPLDMTVAQLKATGTYGFWAVVRFYRSDNTVHTAYLDYVKCEVDYSDGINAYTMIADTGAVTLTGNLADLRAARRLSAEVGAFSLTGNAANLAKSTAVNHYTLTAATGSFALSAGNALLRVGRKLQAGVGIFTTTGRGVVMRVGRRLLAGAGAFAVTGMDAVLSLTRIVAPFTAAFTLTLKRRSDCLTCRESGTTLTGGQGGTLTLPDRNVLLD